MPGSKVRRLQVSAVLIGLALATQGAQPPDQAALDAQFKALDPKFVTPHLPLLKRHAKGEVKAFFLVPADITLGHIREIVQRADIVAEYAAITRVNAPAGALHPADLAEFQKKLQAGAPQVLFSLGIQWNNGLTPPLARELLDRVRGGMGAVVQVRDLKDEPELAAAIAGMKELDAPPLPAVAVAMPAVRRFALGKGRLALLLSNWSDTGDAGEAALGDWATLRLARDTTRIGEWRWRGFEYSYAFLADVVRWAAAQEGPVTVTNAALKSDTVLVTLNNAGEKAMTRVYVTLRSRRWEVRTQGEVQAELLPGESRHLVTLAKAPDGGPLAIEVHVRASDGRTIAFGSVGASAFEAVRLRVIPQAPFGPAEKPGACVVEIEGSVPGGRLEVTTLDRFGRAVDRRDHVVRLEGGKARVASLLRGSRAPSVYHEVVARFSSADAPERLLAEASADVFLLPSQPPYADAFSLGVWGAPERSTLMLQAILPALRELGLTLHNRCDNDLALYASGGLKAACIPSNIGKEEWQKRARAQYDTGARFIGIEEPRLMVNSLESAPQALNGFREWLRKQYADIAELNRAWRANFADFAQVVPKKRQELGNSATLAPWLDFRMFIGEMLAEQHLKSPADWAAEIAPDLSVGEWALTEPSDAWPVDWSRYAKCYRHAARAGERQGVLEDLFRSFAPDSRLGATLRAGADGTPALDLWLTLLAGGSLAWFKPMFNDGSRGGAVLTSDQRPTAELAALARDVFPDLTGGLDRLLLASKFSPDPIAVAYSYPSWLADPEALARAAKTIVEELGFQHLFVTMDDVAAGRLEKDGFKLLIIQQASCLSKEQVEGVKRFVEAGGILLCIGRAGWRDLHGAPHAEGCLLDSLTGVDTSKAAPLGRTLATPAGEPALTLAVADSGVVAKEATVLATVALDPVGGASAPRVALPIWTVRDLGRGKVYWLNALVGTGGPQDVRKSQWDIFDHVIAMASLRPRCRFYADGEPIYDGETWYYETPSGRTLLIAHYFNRKLPGPVTARLQRKGIIYELVTKRLVGDSETIHDTFPEGSVRVYAILDYRCTGIAAKAEEARLNPGEVARVKCTIKIASKEPDKAADLHPIRLRLLNPGGAEVPGFRKVVLARDGEATADFPIPLDAQPGTHYVHALDVISGQETRATFTVLRPDARAR